MLLKKERSAAAFIIPAAIALLLLISAPQAARAADVVYIPAIDTLSVSYDGCVPGNTYAVLLVEGTSPQGELSGSSLLFIDQVTANGRGEVFIAFVSPEFPECTVLLGGQFRGQAASPVTLGVYTPMEEIPAESLVLPDMLTAVGDEAFAGGAYTHVYLGERVTGIGSKAFSDSPSLVYIYIPDSVTSIAADAFLGSPNVTVWCHEGSFAQRFAQDNGIPVRIKE